MNRQDIKDMIAKVYGVAWTNEAQLKDLESFAALVASTEREACAKICDGYSDGRHANMADLCAEAIRAKP